MRGRVVLGVGGGIAAFRAVELARALVHAGCQVYPILTWAASQLVTPRTFAVLTGHKAQVSLWSDPESPGIDHTQLSQRVDLLVVCPATANLLAKMASGVADDALTTYALAHRRAVVLAPAMNTFMWEKPAIQQALHILKGRGAVVVEPVFGRLADGEVGMGKLAPVETICAACLAQLPKTGPLADLRLLVTAGPTREALDEVRVLTNRSSGRMGVALALAAQALGAEVRLLVGPGVTVPEGLASFPFFSAEELGKLLTIHAPWAQVVLHAAAVADFRPRQVARGKLDRRQGPTTVELEPVPDLTQTIRAAVPKPYVVIFAAEQGSQLAQRAQRKLAEKGADAVVANPIDEPGVGMEAPLNRAELWTVGGRQASFPPMPKEELAREILLTLAGEWLHRP
ncbi:MAG: bifunctional phosphopantothenoylcysteine decarboxylase/phosphopantothenate--cysteine ligase CoaBC [Thermoanaerobaculum sp.]|nr:bifunctional phosphopantothenoylcysteine decarboxylase/phosphopantothenate--cysteine ligase CoaBC [Thermoanaerobaculum sp.]